MQVTGTITPNWQLHIPVKIREKSGITKHGKVKIKADKGIIVISKQKNDIMSLAGSIKVKNPIPADKIRDYIDYSNL